MSVDKEVFVDFLVEYDDSIYMAGWFYLGDRYIDEKLMKEFFSVYLDDVVSSFDSEVYSRKDVCLFYKNEGYVGFILKFKNSTKIELEFCGVYVDLKSSDISFSYELLSMQPYFNHDFIEFSGFKVSDMDLYCKNYSIIMMDHINWSKFEKINNIRSGDGPKNYLEFHEEKTFKYDDFDSKFYLELYPDLKGVDPLRHYYLHGKNEGRIASREKLINLFMYQGAKEFDPSKKTIIVSSHESSATGAPLVGLNLAMGLHETYNVVNFVVREKNLHEAFQENCFKIFCFDNAISQHISTSLEYLSSTYDLEAVICNSVETYDIAFCASQLHIPVLSLLHEFSEYTRPKGKLANFIVSSDKIVVPANIIKDSACLDVKDNTGCEINEDNFVVLPQGKLPYIPESSGENSTVENLKKKIGYKDGDKVIVSAGFVQPRKGTDLFAYLAEAIKKIDNSTNYHLLWVGDGYDPDNDLSFSFWIKDYIKNLKLNVHFIEHQKNLDNVLEIADVFCLPSRLDPFPNVVIDALTLDVPVVCFDKATGCAEFFSNNKCNAKSVSYMNLEKMAQSIVIFCHMEKNKLNSQLVKEKLCFDKYLTGLKLLIQEVKCIAKLKKEVCDKINSYNRFDKSSEFFSHLPNPIKYYVDSESKGISQISPEIGFSKNMWMEKNDDNSYIPYLSFLESGLKTTHNLTVLNGQPVDFSKKVAVHLHLFYLDLIDEFAHYFSCLPSFDLFVTVCEDVDLQSLELKFKDKCSSVSEVFIHKVKNIGRDINPFHSLGDCFFDYDVVGHFHSKKSKDVLGVGNKWRRYLLSNLISSKPAALQILSLFNSDKVGLIFAEDSKVVGLGQNKKFYEEIVSDANLDSQSGVGIFPLGTMFWAKPTALKGFFSLDLSKYLLEEPLPYDGSYMHAFERLIPKFVESEGFEWGTVYSKNTSW